MKMICIAGPTASGKTALAVRLARELDGEVVSCDSMQIYRKMNIGTAKPTPEEMRGIPHHMLDVAEPDEEFSVGKYTQMADACVRDILSRGKTVIIAGGTGLYMDSLISGRSFAPVPSTGVRERLEKQAEEQGSGPLLRQLREADPQTAARLHPSDTRRIIRALEVWLETGDTISAHNERTKQLPPRYSPVWLLLDFEDRQDLYGRIDRRVDKMFADGLEDEVRGLLDSGIPGNCTAMQAIGYKETAAALRGEISAEEAAAQIKLGTRHYAKRQLTWFRRNEKMNRLALNADAAIPEDALRAALEGLF